jgi:hypothetical protein
MEEDISLNLFEFQAMRRPRGDALCSSMVTKFWIEPGGKERISSGLCGLFWFPVRVLYPQWYFLISQSPLMFQQMRFQTLELLAIVKIPRLHCCSYLVCFVNKHPVVGGRRW